MNLILSTILFLLVSLTILCTFMYPIIESMTPEEVHLVCPPFGEDGTIQCPNIEDPVLQKQTCDALVQQCELELNNSNKPEITNPKKGNFLFESE